MLPPSALLLKPSSSCTNTQTTSELFSRSKTSRLKGGGKGRRHAFVKTQKASSNSSSSNRFSFDESDAMETGEWSPYEVLEVDSNASAEEIRIAYKNKMKVFHPDVVKDKNSNGKAAFEINKAYVLLSEKREQTNSLLSAFSRSKGGRNNNGKTKEQKEGVVGPMSEYLLAELVVCGSVDDKGLSEECSIDVQEIIVDEIQQFCSVLAFSSEMPLPMPIQVDRLENGVRMAFVRWDFDTKNLEQVGSLWFEYDTDDGMVKIARRWQKGETKGKRDELPGEKRILEDFYEQFKYLKSVGMDGLRGEDEDGNAMATREKEEQKGMKGALAMAMAFALPVLPTPPTFGKKVTPGGAYSHYAIKKNHKITDVDLGF